MANLDAPLGFRFLRKKGGGEPEFKEFSVDSANATAIFLGDSITAEDDGNITPSAANDGINVLGVAVGIRNSEGEPIKFLAASTAGSVIVNTDENSIYSIQSDSTTIVPDTVVFATANHVAGAGNTDTGQSGHELDTSDIGVGLQLRILGRVQTSNNQFGEANVNLEVQFNEILGKSGTATI